MWPQLVETSIRQFKKRRWKRRSREEPIRRSDHNSKLGNPRRKITARRKRHKKLKQHSISNQNFWIKINLHFYIYFSQGRVRQLLLWTPKSFKSLILQHFISIFALKVTEIALLIFDFWRENSNSENQKSRFSLLHLNFRANCCQNTSFNIWFLARKFKYKCCKTKFLAFRIWIFALNIEYQ